MLAFVQLVSHQLTTAGGQQYLSRSAVIPIIFSILPIFSLPGKFEIFHDHKNIFSSLFIKPNLLKFTSERSYLTYLYQA